MGVDFYSCQSCGESFPDCGEYSHCRCGRMWCDDDCADKDALEYEDEEIDKTSCKFCRKEDVDDYKLVAFLLECIGISRQDAVKKYNLSHEKRSSQVK